MISRVVIRNFKRFEEQVFDLSDSVVLAGPNNSGKTTLLQALSVWWLALDRWRNGRGASKQKKLLRSGQPLTRKDFTALPVGSFDLLWHNRSTSYRSDELAGKSGRLRPISIEVSGTGVEGEGWSLTMELRYQSSELIYVKPLLRENEEVPVEALKLSIVHCPPFSGIGAEERRVDLGAQNLEIGQGKPGNILRNLLLEVSNDEHRWRSLAEDIDELFGYTLRKPDYEAASMPFIRAEYVPSRTQGRSLAGSQRYDIASAGSGFHQVLILLSFFYARGAAILLLDEPDAHLHVILQRQIYDRLRLAASRQHCQLLVATHSEVILDGTSPAKIISFLGEPHSLMQEGQRDQAREAMARLTALDLLLAEQSESILYCEGETDFRILEAMSKTLNHPSSRFFQAPFFHANGGRNPREARGHFFALRAIDPDIRALLLLDGDNRNLPDREVGADGLTIRRWPRYEIENYLLVPSAIERFIGAEFPGPLLAREAVTAAHRFFQDEFPPAALADPLGDHAFLHTVPASKEILPKLFRACGIRLEKAEYWRIVESMNPDEIHPDIAVVLHEIERLATASDSAGGAAAE